MVDTRLRVSAGKFSELTQAVWCCGVMSFKAKRIFLQEVLQCLEWGLHVDALSEAALQRLEKAERSFFKRICVWNGYPPAKEADGVPGGHPVSVTYERYLQFFEFHPLRKRLQNTRLKFLRRILRSPAKLGRALLLGTLDFEKEGRVPTAWDRLIEEDLQLLGLVRGGGRSKAEWFEFMWQVDEAEWERMVDALLTARVELPQVPVAQQFVVKCTECADVFETHAAIARHRRKNLRDGFVFE